MELQLGTWQGKVDFSVAPMDDFNIILGMDFLKQFNPIPFPRLNMVMILEGAPCLVPAISPAKETSPKLGAMLLSTMQVEKGLKKGEETWLATLKEDTKDRGNDDAILSSIQNVLEEFKDVMPFELPKKFPPKREVDHQIELELGAKPLAKALYRISPLELEELRRQLKELLDIDFIQLFKSPFGSPVLFKRRRVGLNAFASIIRH